MYNHKEIEKKWQDFWEKNKTFKTENPIFNTGVEIKKKWYSLDMFPYPSWAGLHVWHPEWFTANDIIARYKHALWYNVLHPMWWDAFWLPAENYAIKTWTHPRITTDENIKTFKSQLKKLGFSYDWDREIDTTDPDYYKWTQWIFLKLFEYWLAYEQDLPINYCPSCKTGLANEEVLNDFTCERCGEKVEKKKIRQWVLAITKYAERLLKDVDKLDWPESIKEMQRNWIWRSEWCEFEMEKHWTWENVVILHWRQSENKNEINWKQNKRHWIPWLKEELEKIWFNVFTPCVENDWEVKYDDWKKEIEKLKNKINKSTTLIWTSAWWAFWVRWLWETKTKVKKLVLVAPVKTIDPNHDNWFDSKNGFWDFEIDKSIKERVWEITIFISNDKDFIINDSYNYGKILGAKIIELENRGHFTIKDNPINIKIPEVLYEVIKSIRVYTTRVDTVFGMTYAVLAPDHPQVLDFITEENKKECLDYIKKAKKKSDQDRIAENKEKTWVFTWSYVINPFNKEKVPLWIADYVLGNYWTWAVMAVPAHDERDFEFAKKYGLEVKQSIWEKKVLEIWKKKGFLEYFYDEKLKCFIIKWEIKTANTVSWILVNSWEFSWLTSEEAKEKMTEFASKNWFWEKKVNYKLRDWLFSRQRYWWEPIPLIHLEDKDLDKLVNLNFYEEKNIDLIIAWTKTVETRALNPEEKDRYFWDIKLWDAVIFTDKTKNEKYLVKVNKIINWKNLEELYKDKDNLEKIFPNFASRKISSLEELKKQYLFSTDYVERIEKNWLIWFEFEIVSKIYTWLYGKIICDYNLPLKLPEVEEYVPAWDGKSPLAEVFDFVNIKLANNLKGKRETNTMPQWWWSCWYYLRFMDPKNPNELVNKEIEKYWWQVDSYVWWAEHAVLHLLYARFWHKFLFDIWVVSTDEPFYRLRNQGLILAHAYERKNGWLLANDLVEEKDWRYFEISSWEEVNRIISKMSKSLKNVINPDDIVKEFWADSLRLYEMYMAEFKDTAPWDTKWIIGVRRFLEKAERLYDKNAKISTEDDNFTMKLLHKTIKKVEEDIENYKFNTAIAALMILVNNWLPKDENLQREWKSVFVKLLHPFAPHLAEELNERLSEDGKNQSSVYHSLWPKYDEKMTKDDEVTIWVQVLGKLRWEITISLDEDEKSVLEKAKTQESVKKWIDWKEIIKEIYVKGKIVNLVVK